MGSSEEHLRFELDGGVATLTLQRPEQDNAFSHEMGVGLSAAYRRCDEDDAVRAVVLTGAGRAFCVGADLAAGAATFERPESPGFSAAAIDPPAFALRKPVIAAVNGVAAGGGFVLAALCDLRFASTDAAFTVVFSKRGLVAEHGSAWLLPRLLGPGRALDLLWSSRKIGAEEAQRIGLVEFVTEPVELLATARDYVVELAATVSPASLADTKRMVYRQLGLGYPEALRETDVIQWKAVDRPDAMEGVRSFVERRPPRFARLGTK